MKKNINITKSISFACLGILLAVSLITSIAKVNPIRALSMPITPPITSPITPPNTPIPIPSRFHFQATKTSVTVEEKFFLNWIWENSGNPATQVTFTTNIPKGISLNWNNECQSGNGCQITYTMYKGSGAGQTITTDARGLQSGTYLLTTNFRETGGFSGTQSISIVVSSAVTPTPTLIPTVTPTQKPTPTATVIPTVTPTPQPNQKPVIQTNSLPNAKRGSNYWARINTYDIDSRDTLSMTISGLPSGLSKTNCATFYRNDPATGKQTVWLGCDIEGRTYSPAATYKVQVTVKDNKGGIATKTLLLKVN